MNLVRYGSHRDREIIDTVQRYKALTTEQIAVLLFLFKTGNLKAQTRLLKLFKAKRIKRVRLSFDTPNIYFLGQKHGRLEHLIGINWILIWQQVTFRNWESLYFFDHEQDYGILQSDALLGIKNSATGDIDWAFIEMDRESGNKFDKVDKYNTLYETDGALSAWWYSKAKKFPRIVIVTETEKKLKTIRDLIEKQNRNNLRFEAHLLSDIIKEAKDLWAT